MTIHQKQVHPEPVADCYGCRVSSVRLGIGRLRRDNREHMTQSARGRDTVESAKAAGVDIQPKTRWI